VIYLEHKENQRSETMDFIHIRVPSETRQELKVIAATLGISMTQLIGELINEYLSEKKGTKIA
jgi:predicted DNA-binding protein